MNWFRRFLPQPVALGRLEQIRATMGALLGILATGALSTALIGTPGELPLLIAPMGASAVLLFGLPASPLAQPWSIMGGNICAALIGITAAHLIASPLIAAAVAVAGAFAAMATLRCIHPPSGAVALTAVLGGRHILAEGYQFLFVPVALNSAMLTGLALIYNNLTGRSYPHIAHAPAHPHPPRHRLSPTRTISTRSWPIMARRWTSGATIWKSSSRNCLAAHSCACRDKRLQVRCRTWSSRN